MSLRPYFDCLTDKWQFEWRITFMARPKPSQRWVLQRHAKPKTDYRRPAIGRQFGDLNVHKAQTDDLAQSQGIALAAEKPIHKLPRVLR